MEIGLGSLPNVLSQEMLFLQQQKRMKNPRTLGKQMPLGYNPYEISVIIRESIEISRLFLFKTFMKLFKTVYEMSINFLELTQVSRLFLFKTFYKSCEQIVR